MEQRNFHIEQFKYNDAVRFFAQGEKKKPTISLSYETPVVIGDNITVSSVTDSAVELTSSNTSAISISSGKFVAVGAGSSTLSASVSATEEYNADSISVSITVEKKTPSVLFSASSVSVSAADPSETSYPTLSNNSDGTVTYSSSASSVATVDSSTGDITLGESIAEGDSAVITASVAASDTYKAAEASYTINIVA